MSKFVVDYDKGCTCSDCNMEFSWHVVDIAARDVQLLPPFASFLHVFTRSSLHAGKLWERMVDISLAAGAPLPPVGMPHVHWFSTQLLESSYSLQPVATCSVACTVQFQDQRSENVAVRETRFEGYDDDVIIVTRRWWCSHDVPSSSDV